MANCQTQDCCPICGDFSPYYRLVTDSEVNIQIHYLNPKTGSATYTQTNLTLPFEYQYIVECYNSLGQKVSSHGPIKITGVAVTSCATAVECVQTDLEVEDYLGGLNIRFTKPDGTVENNYHDLPPSSDAGNAITVGTDGRHFYNLGLEIQEFENDGAAEAALNPGGDKHVPYKLEGDRTLYLTEITS